MFKGIDVSYFQGDIDWDAVKPNIDFAMIRAGYGRNTIDNKATRNIAECERLNIPFGLYWFGYPLSAEMAANEARILVQFIGNHKIPYPIMYDWEYASESYAAKNGVKPTRAFVLDCTRAFCETMEKHGFYCGFYTNNDLYLKYYQSSDVTKNYDMWFARYANAPGRKCGMWQTTDKGSVPGIQGKVDMDIAYHNYPVIMDKNDLNNYK